MLSCKTVISVNGQQPVDCLPITHEDVLALGPNGVTTHDLAAVRLELDAHDELVVVSVGQIPASLERCGRKLQLREGKPVRICENDVLLMNESSIRIVKSTFLISKSVAPKTPWLQTTKRILAASAAVFSMTAMAACEEDGADVNRVQQGQQVHHGACAQGDQKCDGNDVLRCEGGAWRIVETCDGDKVCVEESNASAYCKLNALSGDVSFECSEGEMKCGNNSVYRCEDGFWELDHSCVNGDECVQVSNTSAYCEMEHTAGILPAYECTPGEMKCDGNDVYACNGGFWELDKSCDTFEVCVEQSNDSAVCDVVPLAGDISLDCDDGEMKCDGNDIYACKNGVWELDKSCDTFEICVEQSNNSAVCEIEPLAGVIPLDCNDGEMKCEGNDVYACKNGVWELDKSCSGDEVCIQQSNTSAICQVDVTEGEMIPDCFDGDVKCDGNSIYKCKDYEWVLDKSCSADEVCIQESNSSAVCAADVIMGNMVPEICDDGEVKCDGNSIYKCKDGVWQSDKVCDDDQVCIQQSNTSAICAVDVLAGEPLPPDDIENP